MDYQLLKYIQEHRIESLDPTIQFISKETTSITIGAVSALIFLGILIKKHKSLLMVGLKTLVVIIMNTMVVGVLKIVINRPRPFATYEDIIKLSSGESPSLPSGHSAEVFALAFSMLFILKNKTAFYVFLFWAILVGYTRMATGVHYFSDVLVGAVIGVFMAWLIGWLFEKYLPEKSKQDISKS